jgi:hypothetical protein
MESVGAVSITSLQSGTKSNIVTSKSKNVLFKKNFCVF